MPGEDVQLSKNFNSKEFESPDKEGIQVISAVLVRRLEILRKAIGRPIVITSGFRSRAYQEDLKARGYQTAKGISSHERGIAVDIKKDYEHDPLLECECLNLFPAVGVAKGFIHVDLRDDKQRFWRYS
jgi:uncharacterized protein YcbK (DUF882 family)